MGQLPEPSFADLALGVIAIISIPSFMVYLFTGSGIITIIVATIIGYSVVNKLRS